MSRWEWSVSWLLYLCLGVDTWTCGCWSAHMHVIALCYFSFFCFCFHTLLSFSSGVCWTATHKHTRDRSLFGCISVLHQQERVYKISVCLCFLSVCGRVSLSPADTTGLEFKQCCHFTNTTQLSFHRLLLSASWLEKGTHTVKICHNWQTKKGDYFSTCVQF